MEHLEHQNMELLLLLLDLLPLKVYLQCILDTWNMIKIMIKFLLERLLFKTHKCFNECKKEDNKLSSNLPCKINLFLIVIQIT